MVPRGVMKQLSVCFISKPYKLSLYRSRLQRFPTLPQTREEIDFSGERTRTARQEDFLLVTLGKMIKTAFQVVAFATVGNLEKLCEAETIYPAHSCSISSSRYMLCIMALSICLCSVAEQNNHHLQSRRHHLFHCSSISRITPPRLLLPFLTGNMESFPKPRATSGVHQQ